MVADVLVNIPHNQAALRQLGQRNFDLKELKETGTVRKMEVVSVSVENQLENSREDLDETVVRNSQMLSSHDTLIIQSYQADEIRYLDQQIEDFIEIRPEWRDKLIDCDMATVLEFNLAFLTAGTGRHNDHANYNRTSSAINIHDPPETKCATYNRLFQLGCERTMDRFNPALKNKYTLLMTHSKAALDLPRVKSEGGGSKQVKHSFLTLVSMDQENRLCYSTVDPYHAGDTGGIAKKLDYTEERSADSLNVLCDLFLVDYWGQFGSTLNMEGQQLKAVMLTNLVENAQSVTDAGEIGLVLSSQWGRVWMDYQGRRKDYERLRETLIGKLANYNREKSRHKEAGNNQSMVEISRKYAYDTYNKANENYVDMRFRYEFVAEIKDEFQEAIQLAANRLVDNMNQKTAVDPKESIIFFDLLDDIGYYGITVKDELWDKAIKIVETSRTTNIENWKQAVQSGGRREWTNHLRRHFDNPWQIKPVETVITKDDAAQVDEESVQYKYVRFRASVLRLMKETGVSGWEKYLPKDTPGGSYAEMLVKLVSQED